MNYELAICFLFVLLFIIYFYIRKQPIIEGAGKGKSDIQKMTDFFKNLPKQINKIPKDINKKAKAEFDKAKEATNKEFNKAKDATNKEFNKAKDATNKVVKDAENVTKKGIEATKKGIEDAQKEAKKGINIIKTELIKVKDSILGPIIKFAKQVENFFKNLARLFTDWVNFINGNLMCAIKNVSNPVCLLWNVIRLIGLILYGLVWLIILSFAGQSTADSFECIIIKIEDFLWKFHPKILDTCSKGCSSEIPIWGGKKLKSPADKTRSKCNAKLKSTIKFEEENITSDRTFYWVVLIFFVFYKLDLPSIVQKWFNQPSNAVLNEINPPSNMAFETNNPILKPVADK